MTKSNIVYFLMGLSIAIAYACGQSEQEQMMQEMQRLIDEAKNCPELATELTDLQTTEMQYQTYLPPPIAPQQEYKCTTLVAQIRQARNNVKEGENKRATEENKARSDGIECVLSNLSNDEGRFGQLNIRTMRDALTECGLQRLLVGDGSP